MLTLSDQLTEYLDITKDSTEVNKKRGIRRINQYLLSLLNSRDYWWQEDEYSFSTVADTQAYKLPVNSYKTGEVKAIVGTTQYVVQEIQSYDAWTALNYNTSNNYSYPVYFFIDGDEIQLYPKPSSVYTIKMRIQKRQKPLKYEDYKTGTISVTNGSATVTGTDTDWSGSDKFEAGSYILINEVPYEISSITDDDTIILTKEYQGSTASALEYRIGDCAMLPEGFQDLPWLASANHYYLRKEDSPTKKEIKAELLELESRLNAYSTSKTSVQVFPRRNSLDYQASIDRSIFNNHFTLS